MSEIIDNFKKVFFANFANFEGRARRSEFWLFHLVLQILYTAFMVPFVFYIIFMILESIKSSAMGGVMGVGFIIMLIVFCLAFLVFVMPSLAVTARRLHDTNRSGWWMLLGCVPFGIILLFYFLVLDGNEKYNEFGADPKEEERNYYRNLAAQQSVIPTSDDQQGYVQNY